MKVLFLDIDGVLNSVKFYKQSGKKGGLLKDIDGAALGRLLRVVLSTDCKIVISSSWRIQHTHNDIREMLLNAGWPGTKGPPIIGSTPVHNWGRTDAHPGPPLRGEEIKAWLDVAKDVTHYAIVDDDSDMLPEQMDHFVQTSWEDGLLDEHVEKLKAILGK